MFRRLHRFLGLSLLLLLIAGPALAQTTGSVSGVVRAADGSPLPGVTVTVSGPLLPAGRTAVTDEEGRFSVLRLPPGEYEVNAALEGMGSASRPAVVALDKDTQVELGLSPTVSEEITVEAVFPTVDVKASDVQANFTGEEIDNLPIPRTYKGLFQLAPGVSENLRLAPNAGASRMDNTYLVDGINVTNPHYGDIVQNITDLDIAEVSIKRGGISAEFGRAAGMVVNAITKSGTNDLGGEVRLEYAPSDFVSDTTTGSVQNTRDRETGAASLGGPILRDRAWFYGSVSLQSDTTTERSNFVGALPDEDRDTDEYFGKLTANPAASHLLAAAVRSREEVTGNGGIGASFHPSTASEFTTEYLLGTLGWTWNATADSLVELKLNHNEENNSGIPQNNLGYRPAFNAARPDLVGRFTTTADRIIGGASNLGQIVGGADLLNFQDFERDEARLSYQRFAAFGGTRHDLRAGVTYDRNEEHLERRANGWGVITWNPSTRQFTATYVSEQPPHVGRAETWGVFVQDQINFGERTTLTAGLLVNRDDYYGEGVGSTPGTKRRQKILTFDWDQQIQPRLGISFVPSPQRGDKVYASFGRYYNTENKSLTRAASPTRIFTTRATFDENGNLLSEVPQANTQTKTIDAGLNPMYTDELLAGYARPLGDAWSAEVWAMYREVGDIFEDVSADGLGNGPFRVSQLPDAYREYTAATLQVNRRAFNDRLMRLYLNMSYTWSRLEGNWDIDFSPSDSPFYNSSFIQDGPGVLITDNRDGLLRGDRTHLVKVFASIQPFERVRAGTYVRFQSGGAWEARALPDANVSSASHFRYLEPAGSRRMDDWLNVDLLGAYEFRFAGIGLELEARVANVFDEQVELAVDDRFLVGRVPESNVSNNPNFGRGTLFSDPRTLVLSAIVRY
ncbi:MAG TPA: TonB-dependent receptor [Thermoanaerobaculia bacterium]|nr:TonB-dependent receptor [Thermoanaerobaculia bacterium]